MNFIGGCCDNTQGENDSMLNGMAWSLFTKSVTYILPTALISVLLLTCLYSGSTTVPTVAYPQLYEKISPRSLKISDSTYTPQPGAADMVGTINLFRTGLTPLYFAIPSAKDSRGYCNPLTVAATSRNTAWGSLAQTPSTSDFVSPSTIGGSLTTDSAISTAFSGTGYTVPSSYKEYDYYGEYCTSHLFLIMKNGPSSTSNPGYGIQNDIVSKTWTNIAIAIGQNPVDANAVGISGLGNAYWTIIFSTSFSWTQATKKPTKVLTVLPPVLTTNPPSVLPSAQPSYLPSYQPSKVKSVQPTLQPTKLPTKPPTKLPSKQPALLPTKMPTKLPTLQPSKLPSKLPTVQPTKPPTSKPK